MGAVADLDAWMATSGLSLNALEFMAGVVLLAVGSRHYRVALVLPAVVLGALGADLVLSPLIEPPVRLLVVVAVGAAVGGLAGLLESLAVRLAGALLGLGMALSLWPLIVNAGAAVPWWVPLGGGLLGLGVFPGLYRTGLRVVVPLLGALILTQAIGRPGHPVWVLALFAAGFLFDTMMRRRHQD